MFVDIATNTLGMVFKPSVLKIGQVFIDDFFRQPLELIFSQAGENFWASRIRKKPDKPQRLDSDRLVR